MECTPHFEVFKEPKPFLKLIEIIFAIIAFALTTNFSSHSSFVAHCNDNSTTFKIQVNYSYPFNLKKEEFGSVCNIKQKEKIIYGNYQSQSQFYVFVGVIAMLYCFAALILYVFFTDISYQNDRIPKADFIVTAVIAVLWLIASIAWADGVSKLKMYTDPHNLAKDTDYCKINSKMCNTFIVGAFGGLQASLVGGFANVLLWAGNLWFVFKDTLWYDRRNPDDQIVRNESVDGGNM